MSTSGCLLVLGRGLRRLLMRRRLLLGRRLLARRRLLLGRRLLARRRRLLTRRLLPRRRLLLGRRLLTSRGLPRRRLLLCGLLACRRLGRRAGGRLTVRCGRPLRVIG